MLRFATEAWYRLHLAGRGVGDLVGVALGFGVCRGEGDLDRCGESCMLDAMITFTLVTAAI